MKLKPIQISILVVQIIALVLNLNAIFIKKVQDSRAHWLGAILVLIIMSLSIKSWYDESKSKQSSY